MNSENVYAAFAAVIAALPGFKTVERKWQIVEDVDPGLMPYIGIKERSRKVRDRSFDGIETWLLTLDVILYVNQPNQTAPTSPIFNPLVDAIANALPPIGPLLATQAGVQFNAYLPVNADIQFFENWLDNKSVVHLPIEIIAPDNA